MRVVVLVVVTVGLAAGCDLFGQIRCDKDGDCPDAQPFCNAGVCSETDSTGRNGHGVGEGEGEGEGGAACSSDSECAPGLCNDAGDDGAAVGACVPTASDVTNCSEAAVFGSPSAFSTVIFAGTAQRAGGDCAPGSQNVNFDVHFLSRVSLDPTEVQAFVVTESSSSPTATGGGSVETSDGKSGDAFLFDRDCVPDSDTTLVVTLGITSPASNALCIPIP